MLETPQSCHELCENMCFILEYIKKREKAPLFPSTRKKDNLSQYTRQLNIFLKEVNAFIEENSIQKKEIILFKHILSFFGTCITNGINEKSIHTALKFLGEGLDVSRVYIFRNTYDEKKKVSSDQIVEWVAEKVSSQQHNKYVVNVSFLDLGMQSWHTALSHKKIVTRNKKQFTPAEKKLFCPQKIESLMVIPIFVKSDWWGFIGVDECRFERKWTKDEKMILQIVAYVFAILREKDIAESNYAQEHKRMEHIINFVPNAIFYVDKNRKILSWNKHAEEITGYKKKEVVGQLCTALSLFPPEEQCLFFNKKEKKPILNREGQMIRKDGKPIWVSRNIDVVLNERGVQVGGIESFIDITAQKAQKELMKQKLNDLEKLNRFMIGRELKMRSLKDQVDELKRQLQKK